MRNRMPPMRALRDFEAVGRHGSLSAAARELAVTPAAVSRQIAQLERHFGCPLFVRHRRGLALTHTGSAYFETIRDAFDRIDDAGASLLLQPENRLSIRVHTGIATEWLIPRLPAFQALHPSVEISLTASLAPIQFDSAEPDLAIAPGMERSPRLRQDVLFDSIYFPVCSPALLASGPPLEKPEDLRQHTLLYSPRQLKYWQAWLARAGVHDIGFDRATMFDSSSAAYRAARQGAGVALGKLINLTDDLIAGRLAAPFPQTVRAGPPYCVISLRRRANAPSIVAFRDWVAREVQKTEQQGRAVLNPLLFAEAETRLVLPALSGRT